MFVWWYYDKINGCFTFKFLILLVIYLFMTTKLQRREFLEDSMSTDNPGWYEGSTDEMTHEKGMGDPIGYRWVKMVWRTQEGNKWPKRVEMAQEGSNDPSLWPMVYRFLTVSDIDIYPMFIEPTITLGSLSTYGLTQKLCWKKKLFSWSNSVHMRMK